MKIGFIGSGAMAQALAEKWRGKHDLFFSGRNLEKAAQVAAGFGAKSGPAAEAAAFGEVVVLATRWEDALDAVAQAGGDAAFASKVVIDINNPVSVETFLTTRDDGRSLTQALAEALPGAELGKAFNMAQAAVWADPDMTYDGRTLVTLFTADSERASEVIAGLIRDVGSEPLRLGGNAHAYQLEAAAAIVIKFLFAGRDPHTVFNFIQPDVRAIR
ncbi:NADPH-dependent F420 reductase [Pelagibius sp.]|uniref:NADPH-dependent F420 reductase n=1 Tax=Pelagibius sp. TaxID=1931238 RepID=UPI00261CE47E|nr:NAD(P)-binding domain-containing protein [Pelagibius sp.]